MRNPFSIRLRDAIAAMLFLAGLAVVGAPAEKKRPDFISEVEKAITPPPPKAAPADPADFLQSVEAPSAPHPFSWKALRLDYTAKAGDRTNLFAFHFTNTSSAAVVIRQIRPSCGCTTAGAVFLPWKIEPKGSGEIPVLMNFAGKHGSVVKTITIDTTAGPQVVTVAVTIPEEIYEEAMSGRLKNQRLALADRQAVFKNDCATCHVEPARNKMGQELYEAACAICHDSPNRASMVPNLKTLTHPTSRDFWQQWISIGKEGSLMPAFAQSSGGPLSKTQIDSLADYLERNFKPLIIRNPALIKAPVKIDLKTGLPVKE